MELSIILHGLNQQMKIAQLSDNFFEHFKVMDLTVKSLSLTIKIAGDKLLASQSSFNSCS